MCVCVCEYKPSNETTVVVGGLLEYGGEEKKTVYALALGSSPLPLLVRHLRELGPRKAAHQ